MRVSLSIRVTSAARALGEQDGQHEPGKAGAGAEIEPALGARRGERQELGRIGEVAVPDVGQRARGDEIDGLLPLPQQSLVSLEPLKRFT